MIMMKMVLTFKTIRKILIVKNIYLLPTGKATRGLVLLNSIYRIEKGLINYPKDLYPDAEGYDVYITSDEEIKEGDYVLYYEDKISQVLGINIDELKLDRGGVWRSSCKKIIFTTDQDLLKNGVQKISNDFLEWFVKNPTCEFVEIKQLLSNNGNASFGYKIITTKEKQKQILSKMMQEDEKSGLYEETLEQVALNNCVCKTKDCVHFKSF